MPAARRLLAEAETVEPFCKERRVRSESQSTTAPCTPPGHAEPTTQSAEELTSEVADHLALRCLELLWQNPGCPRILLTEGPERLENCRQMLACSFRLLGRHGFSVDSAELAAAHGTRYLCALDESLRARGAKEMKIKACAFSLIVLIFLAHVHTEDQAISMKHWHQYVFKGSSSFEKLNAAVLAILGMLNYRLRLPDDELLWRLAFLHASC